MHLYFVFIILKINKEDTLVYTLLKIYSVDFKLSIRISMVIPYLPQFIKFEYFKLTKSQTWIIDSIMRAYI